MKQIAHAAFAVVLVLASDRAEAQRLPQTIVPIHYSLAFTPDFATDTFTGDETIAVKLTQASTAIVLNAAEIEVQDVRVTSGGRSQPAIVALDPGRETATFTVAESIAAGTAEVHIRFTGHLNDKLRGFYLGKANNRKYALTQLEATDARRAFPCFDEPALKATFDITLTVDAADTAISNGRVLSDTPGPASGKHTLKFSTTPKMSTYLVAMLVGDFECREGAADGVPIRVCSTPDKKALTGFALEAAEQQVRFYNAYYGITYPYGKLDVIAVPDFSAGAMENTAAITFREVLLLADPQTASLTAKKNIASVLSHEIAHMWFGDLVTMQWWDDVWLNEGFATWMANKPLAAWKPEWATDLDDVVSNQSALYVDSLEATHPIKARMETPDEINEAFDAIAYQKGAAVLRMLEHYVGEDAFRRGVGAYLRKYSYANATFADFAAEIAAASSKPVDRIMSGFVEQPGTPLISVESVCSSGATTVRLRQTRFFASSTAPASNSLWQVPVCMKIAGSKTATCDVLQQAEQTFTLPACGPVFVNAGANGYYRSAYSTEAITAIAPVIGTLTPAERISLIEDEWAIVRAGRHGVASYLTLASALRPDRTAEIVKRVAGRLQFVGEELLDGRARRAYEAWVRQSFGPLGHELEWTSPAGESDERRMLRATALMLLGNTGRDASVLKQARTIAEQYMTQPGSVDGALAEAALEVAAIDGDEALYDRYLGQLKAASGPQQYYRYFNALSFFTKPAIVARALAFAMSDAVKSQDTPALIGGFMEQPETRDMTWSFVKAKWSAIEGKLGVFQGIPAVVSATGAFCSVEAMRDVEEFFSTHKVPAAERGLKLSLEAIENCADMRAREQSHLTEWLTHTN